MAIDLFCYSTFSVAETDEKITALQLDFPDIFRTAFLLYQSRSINSVPDEITDPREIKTRIYSNSISQEIVEPYDIEPVSKFLCALNEKSRSGELNDTAKLIASYFGEKNCLILFDNEDHYATEVSLKANK